MVKIYMFINKLKMVIVSKSLYKKNKTFWNVLLLENK